MTPDAKGHAVPLFASPREVRLARIEELARQRWAGRGAPGVFSATVLTKFALQLAAMSGLTGLVSRGLGPDAAPWLRLPLGFVAILVGMLMVESLWATIGPRVRETWTGIAMVLCVAAICLFVLLVVAPRSVPARAVTEGGAGVVETARQRIAARERARRTPITPAAAAGRNWRLVTEGGALRRGTRAEAEAWCRALGTGWMLPTLSPLPELDPWPRLARPEYAWTSASMAMSIGDGKRPASYMSVGDRADETHVVLCVNGALDVR